MSEQAPSKQLNTYEVEQVLVEHNFGDGVWNADDVDAWRMAEEIVQLRTEVADLRTRNRKLAESEAAAWEYAHLVGKRSQGPAMGGSESRVAPDQPADGERSAPPVASVACEAYTAAVWSPLSDDPEDARCIGCGWPADTHNGSGGGS